MNQHQLLLFSKPGLRRYKKQRAKVLATPRCCQLLPSTQGLGTHLKGHTAVQKAFLDQLLLDGMEPLRAFRKAGLIEVQSNTHIDIYRDTREQHIWSCTRLHPLLHSCSHQKLQSHLNTCWLHSHNISRACPSPHYRHCC